jgi:pimeloyl-CoA synthetase
MHPGVLTSVTFSGISSTVLGTFSGLSSTVSVFYRHLFGHRAGVAVFLALHLLKIESIPENNSALQNQNTENMSDEEEDDETIEEF